MKILLIQNLESGTRYKKRYIDLLISELLLSHQVQYHEVTRFADISSIIKSSQDIDLCLACGGDGTISSIANSLMNTKIPLYAVPIGSGNDFALFFNMTKDIRLITQAIDSLKTSNINTLRIKNQEINVLTILCFGFEAKINRIANLLPRFIGKAKYSVATIICLFGKTYEDLTIVTESNKFRGKYSLAILANTSFFGGGLKITENDNIYGPKAKLILVSKQSRLKIAYLFLLLLLKKHYKRREFEQYEVERIEVISNTGVLKAQGDGESLPVGPIVAEVDRDSLLVVDCR